MDSARWRRRRTCALAHHRTGGGVGGVVVHDGSEKTRGGRTTLQRQSRVSSCLGCALYDVLSAWEEMAHNGFRLKNGRI